MSPRIAPRVSKIDRKSTVEVGLGLDGELDELASVVEGGDDERHDGGKEEANDAYDRED